VFGINTVVLSGDESIAGGMKMGRPKKSDDQKSKQVNISFPELQLRSLKQMGFDIHHVCRKFLEIITQTEADNPLLVIFQKEVKKLEFAKSDAIRQAEAMDKVDRACQEIIIRRCGEWDLTPERLYQALYEERDISGLPFFLIGRQFAEDLQGIGLPADQNLIFERLTKQVLAERSLGKEVIQIV
jgi:hypothetical protein